MNKEQMTQEQREQLIEKLHNEYNDLNGKIARLNAFLCDIDFDKKVPDIIEQELMKGQLRAMENYLSNLRGRIMFQEARQKAEKPLDDWMNMKGKVVNTLCGPVHLVNADEQHHCGQDASCPVGDGNAVDEKPHIPESFKRLVGMQVVAVNDVHCSKCVCGAGYTPSGYPLPECVKIELVGGYYLCLADLPNSIVTE